MKGDPERQNGKSKGLGGLKEEGNGVERMRPEGGLENPRKEDRGVKNSKERRLERPGKEAGELETVKRKIGGIKARGKVRGLIHRSPRSCKSLI